MESSLGKKGMLDDQASARSLLPVHASRILVYQLVVVTCQYAAGLAIGVLLAVEVCKLAWAVRLRRQGVLKNRILVVAEGNQSAFMIGFLVMSGFLHRLSMNEKVPDYWQSVGTVLILGAVAFEYLILAVMLVNGVVSLLRERRAMKAMVKEREASGDMKKFSAMEWFIVYKWIENDRRFFAAKKTKES